MLELAPESHLDIFLRVHRTVGMRLTQIFAQAGAVTPNEARVLTLLSRAPDRRLRIEELAQQLGMTRGATSRIVTRMEREGYVERQSGTADRRAIYASMTSEGRNVLRHATRVFRSVFEQVFLSGLTRPELEELSRLLARLEAANDPSRPPAFEWAFADSKRHQEPIDVI